MANRGPRFVHCVRDVGKRPKRHVRSERIDVVVSAGDRNRNARRDDPRAVEHSACKCIPQRDGAVSQVVSACVAHRRKAAAEILLCILQTEQRFLRSRSPQRAGCRKVVPVSLQMNVTIDQAGKHRGVAQIDHACAGRSLSRNRVDSLAANDDECVGDVPCAHVEQAPRVDGHRLRAGSRSDQRNPEEYGPCFHP